jgi:hypothetical protein
MMVSPLEARAAPRNYDALLAGLNLDFYGHGYS